MGERLFDVFDQREPSLLREYLKNARNALLAAAALGIAVGVWEVLQ